MVDYASKFNQGYILPGASSYSGALYYNSPEMLIDDKLEDGDCWAIIGSNGTVGIGLG